MNEIKDLKPLNEWHSWYNSFGIIEEFRERVEMLEETERLMKIGHSKKIARQVKHQHETAKEWFLEFFNELSKNIEA